MSAQSEFFCSDREGSRERTFIPEIFFSEQEKAADIANYLVDSGVAERCSSVDA